MNGKCPGRHVGISSVTPNHQWLERLYVDGSKTRVKVNRESCILRT